MLYRFFNIPIEIDAESAAIAGQIDVLFAEFADDSGLEPFSRYLVKSANAAGEHLILRDGRRVAGAPETNGPMLALEDAIMAELVREVPGIHFIHAAVLARHGSAIVFAGRSGAGKSTLSLALASRGWEYFSDEVAPVDDGDLRVHPFPRGIKLRPTAFNLFPELRANGTAGKRQYLRLRELPLTLAEGPSKVASLVFPQYRPGAEPRLIPLPKATAARMLAECSLSFNHANGQTLLSISRLVKSIDCYQFDVGDIRESCELIEDFHAGIISAPSPGTHQEESAAALQVIG